MAGQSKDKWAGRGKQVKGKLKEEAGKLTGNKDAEAQGVADQIEGKVQEAWGKTKEKVGDIKDIRMKKFSTALLTLVALLTLSSITLIVSVSANPTAQGEPNNFTAQLGGDQEVPPRTTDATGQATFQLSTETQLDFTLNLVNVKNVVAAHIHCAPAGENGAVGVTLFDPVIPGEGSVDVTSIRGSITAPDTGNGCGWADFAAVVEAMRNGNAYVNAHTNDGVDPPDTGPGDFPDGEVRGQIEAAP